MDSKEKKEISTLFDAGAILIEVVSYERELIYGMINEIANEKETDWFQMSIVNGLTKWDKKDKMLIELNKNLTDPLAMLEHFKNTDTPGIYIVEDFHPFMDGPFAPKVIRYMRDISLFDKSLKKYLILLQPVKVIPVELLKEMSIVEIPLPSKFFLRIILENVVKEFNVPKEKFQFSDKLINAALGLTIMEARLTFSKAVVERGQLTDSEISFIIEEKGNIIKKRGALDYIHPKEEMNSIGGMDILKDWLRQRGNGFDLKAEQYGLDKPRGVLLLGVPGCGKSLSAKAVAHAWNFPLLRFDLGKVYSGIVGESEANIRYALDIAKAIAPCVLWIDEIEKGLSGSASSNQADSGVSARVFGTFLTWMQEKEESVFVVATANDISQIPPELLRKGRFDEIFFVDLPSKTEREEIFQIHLKKKGRNPLSFDVSKLAEKSESFTGSEIEESIKSGMFKAFDQHHEVTTDEILEAIEETTPLATTMDTVIKDLREWALHRAKFASSKIKTKSSKDKKPVDPSSIPRLKQETKNPFL